MPRYLPISLGTLGLAPFTPLDRAVQTHEISEIASVSSLDR